MEQKLKIAIVCDDSLDKTDGVQQYVLTLGSWLTTHGHEVHYLTSTTKRTDIPHMHSLSRNINVKFNNNRNSIPLPSRTSQIRSLLKREQFDVIHVQMPYSPLLAGKIIRYASASTAIIGTFHVFPHNKLMSIGAKLLGIAVRHQMKRFAAILSVSVAARSFAKQSFGIDSQVVPNMVDVQRFAVDLKPAHTKSKKITFLGRLVERKGPMQLLKAVSYLSENGDVQRPFKVEIGGKGPLLDELKTYVDQQRLGKIVNFKGFIAEENKPAFLHNADIAVFPSTGGESFGISLIEAMAATPGVVIAGNNAGYRTVMGEAVDQLIDPNDVKQFANTLKYFIEDDSARSNAHKWQCQRVKQYDIDTVCPQIVSVYHQALQGVTK